MTLNELKLFCINQDRQKTYTIQKVPKNETLIYCRYNGPFYHHFAPKRNSGGPKGRQAGHHNYRNRTTCMHKYSVTSSLCEWQVVCSLNKTQGCRNSRLLIPNKSSKLRTRLHKQAHARLVIYTSTSVTLV